VQQLAEQRGHRRLVQPPYPLGQVRDLHRARVGDADAPDLRGAGLRAEPGAVTVGAGREGDRPVHERPDVRLHRLPVLRQERLLDLRDQALVREIDAVDLDLDRLLVEEVVELLLGVVADRLVRVDETRLGVDPYRPETVGLPARDRERALRQRLRIVVQLREVDVGHRTPALATRAHAADPGERRLLRLAGTPLDGDRPFRPYGRNVEGESLRRAD